MRRLASVIVPALVLLVAPACGFYFGDDDDDDDYQQCDYPPTGDADGAAVAPLDLRNPQTGQCESFYSGGGGGWCDPNCGPCPGNDYGEPAPIPTWGYCDSYCSALGEADCLATDGCRGGYVDVCPPNADCDLEGGIQFYECWAVDQSGPQQGSCEGLDAWSCSLHDDCRAVHANPCLDNGGAFEQPQPVDACLGDFIACIDEPGQTDPGLCYAETLCDSLPPDCPVGSLAGVIDGCWSGYCIPEADCEAPPACDVLGENACIDRADCEALYEGIDCTCDDMGCTCADWLYDSCAPTDNAP